MSAPVTRTLTDEQVRTLRMHRRQFSEFIVIENACTVLLMVRDNHKVSLASAICGDADTFDPEMGEFLAWERLCYGSFISVDESMASEIAEGLNCEF